MYFCHSDSHDVEQTDFKLFSDTVLYFPINPSRLKLSKAFVVSLHSEEITISDTHITISNRKET